MKITLINPPWYLTHRQSFKEKSLSQCLGLGYVASYLKVNGHTIEFIDALAEGMDNIVKISYRDQILLRKGLSYGDIIDRIPPDTQLIGISVPFTNLAAIVKEFSVLLKEKYPRIPVVAGGIHPSTSPYDLLHGNIDYVIRGEGEIPMLQIASGKDPRTVKGIVYRDDNGLVDNGTATQVDDLDRIPFSFRPPGLMEKYLNYSPRGETGKRSISIITSRGCPYDCLFCSVHPVSGYGWRGRSSKNVIEEVNYYIADYGINHVEFEDDNLTLDARRAEEIFDGILALNKKITWTVNNGLRVDTLTPKLIGRMKESGCIQINLAIESGNQKILDLMQKKLSLKKIEEVVEVCNDLKIPTLGFFLVGYPGETKKTFQETLRYIKRLRKEGLKKIGAMIVNAYPGTKLYNYCKEKGYLARDIDGHIFVDNDYVSITTDDFDKPLVIFWRDRLEGIFCPFRWQIKQITRAILPKKVFAKLIYIYRDIRDSIQKCTNIIVK